MNKILAFFGAFNPPTVAHIELARFAKEQTASDGVMFVPSKSVYIRDTQGKDYAFDDSARLSMLRAAAKEREWMLVTDIELAKERQPRTYHTLCKIKEQGYSPSLLLGSDKLPELEHKWLYVNEMATEFGIVCLARGNDECERIISESPFLSSISQYIKVVKTPDSMKNVSSTKVRKLLACGAKREELGMYLTPEVLNFVTEDKNET